MHPWAAIRSGLELTQLEVANKLGVDRQTVIRLEQGLFHAPSEEVLTGLSRLYDTDPRDLVKEYYVYVMETRCNFRDEHPSFKRILKIPYTERTHPLVFYRAEIDISRMGLCKGLCLDYGPVADYEYNKQRSLPESLVLACKQVGWDWMPITVAVDNWRLAGHANK